MRVHICAIGRLRAGPEQALIDDYLTRFDRTGRGIGLAHIRTDAARLPVLFAELGHGASTVPERL